MQKIFKGESIEELNKIEEISKTVDPILLEGIIELKNKNILTENQIKNIIPKLANNDVKKEDLGFKIVYDMEDLSKGAFLPWNRKERNMIAKIAEKNREIGIAEFKDGKEFEPNPIKRMLAKIKIKQLNPGNEEKLVSKINFRQKIKNETQKSEFEQLRNEIFAENTREGLSKTFEKAKEATDNPYTHVELFHHFAELEEKKGNLSQALSLIKQYVDSTETEIQRTKETNLAKAETLFNRKEMLHENFKLRKERENISSYLVGTVFVLLLLSVFYVYRLGRKNRRIIQLTDELQEQKSHLLEQQMALDSLSCQLKAAQQDNLEELRQKQSEYDQKAQEVELLKQQYLQQRQYLLRESTIYKKIQKSVSTPNPDHKELLTDKDWKVIYKCIDTMYPSLSERLVLAGITPTEKKYCYLSFFQLDSKQEAFLLNVNIDTPYKNRTRIRQKLKITGSEEKLYEHLALW